jgi:hypothetical protein
MECSLDEVLVFLVTKDSYLDGGMVLAFLIDALDLGVEVGLC